MFNKIKFNKKNFTNDKLKKENNKNFTDNRTNEYIKNNEKESVNKSINKKSLKKMTIIICIFSLVIIFLLIIVTKFNVINNNSKKIGNNKSIKEIEKVILNINSYNAEAEITIKSNKNENKYKVLQEVKNGKEFQKILEPKSIEGTEYIYENGILQIKNEKFSTSKVYQNFPYITNNLLFLTDFLKQYKSENEKMKEILEKNDKIILKLKCNSKYNKESVLSFNKDIFRNNELKKIDNNKSNNVSMQIYDSNNNARIYIIYNKIEFNI